LWLASSQGPYRFDGVKFEWFALSGQPFTSVPVYSLLSCPNGDLWIGSAVSGISRLGTEPTATTLPLMDSRATRDVDHVAVLIHGTPQILLLAVDSNEDLVQVPAVAEPTLTRFSFRALSGPNFRHQRRIVS
jgi:hypothetical protein